MKEQASLPVVLKYLGAVESNRAEAHALPAVPTAVKKSAERFADAQQAVAEAQHALEAAKADAARAERDDRAAAKEAALAGTAIPKPTTPRAEAAVEEAERRLHALATDALDHGRRSFDDVVANREEWLDALDAEAEKIRAEIYGDLDRALARMPELMKAERTTKELTHTQPSRGEFKLPRFRVDVDRRPLTAPVLDSLLAVAKEIRGVRGKFKTLRTVEARLELFNALREGDAEKIRRHTFNG